MTNLTAFIEGELDVFRVAIWGLAPEGTAKYKRGKEIESFLYSSLHATILKTIEEIEGKLPPQQQEHDYYSECEKSGKECFNEGCTGIEFNFCLSQVKDLLSAMKSEK